jgi:DNA-binding SARP family transcriptional activator
LSGASVGEAMLEFRLLGTLEAGELDTADLGSRKQRALLAYLLLHRNEAVPRDALIDALWPDDPPASAAHSLDVYASGLRKSLGAAGLLEARGGALRLRVEDDAVDVARFEQFVDAAHRADSPTERLAAIDQALALWRGRALADLGDEPFVGQERERLEEQRLVAVEERFDTLLALGRHDEAAPLLQSIVSEHPLRERPRRLLMLALYRAGRQADALEVYQAYRRLLRDELGLDPSPRLRELEAAILRHAPTLAAPAPAGGGAPVLVWQRRRRALLVGAAAIAAIAGSVLAVLLLTGGEGRTLTIPHLSAAAIDPASGRPIAVLPLHGQPIAALGTGDTIWVANSTDRTLTQIDDRSMSVVSTIGLPSQPTALAFGAGRIWIASLDTRHSLSAVDPRSGDVLFSIPLRQPGLGRFDVGRWTGVSDVAFAHGSVWATVGVSGLLRLSPQGKVLHSFVVGPEPLAVTAGPSAVWVALIGPAQLREVDPFSNSVGGVIQVGNMQDGSESRLALHCTIAAAGNSIWAPAYFAPGVWHIDALHHRVVGVVQTGGSPCTVAIGLGRVWVANPNAGELDEIDPVTEAIVRRVAIAAPPSSVAVGRTHVWVITN